MSGGHLDYNPASWTTLASMVFLEQPIGVGFSYSTDVTEQMSVNDEQSSTDNVAIIHAFFQKFPERSTNNMLLACESYGGHYSPQWAIAVLGDPILR